MANEKRWIYSTEVVAVELLALDNGLTVSLSAPTSLGLELELADRFLLLASRCFPLGRLTRDTAAVLAVAGGCAEVAADGDAAETAFGPRPADRNLSTPQK